MNSIYGPAPKGRPRSPETIDRDASILRLLEAEGAMTRNVIADRMRLSRSLTSIAINRLKAAGLVRRCLSEDGVSVWTAEVDEPCP